MYQGTTPTLPIRIKGKDITSAKIYFTLKDTKDFINTHITGDGSFNVAFDGDDTIGEIKLTQEETLKIESGSVKIQCRYIFSDGTAGATRIAKLRVEDILLKEVISYE